MTPAPLDRKPIALVVALAAEVGQLASTLYAVESRARGPWIEHRGQLDAWPIVIIQSGVGMTAAAAATEFAIGAHAPICVLNFGSAGSHVRDLVPGDIVIASTVIACNTLHVLANGEEVFINRQFHVEGQPVRLSGSVIDCDRSLVGLAQHSAGRWQPEPWPQRPQFGYPHERATAIRTGPVISADMWVQSPARIDALHRRHRSLAADMEAAAIGQVATLHQVPFLAIKDISNNELFVNTDIELGEITAPTDEVGKRSAALTRRLMEAIVAQES